MHRLWTSMAVLGNKRGGLTMASNSKYQCSECGWEGNETEVSVGTSMLMFSEAGQSVVSDTQTVLFCPICGSQRITEVHNVQPNKMA